MSNLFDSYFQRVNPTLNRPEEGGHPRPTPPPDFYRAWDQLAQQVYGVLPNQLDRARSFRNRFIRAVR